jgi:hypothetical protein
MVYPASPSKGCRELRLEQRVSKLPREVSEGNSCRPSIVFYHASAGECVPTESNAITILHLVPLVFQRLIVHLGEEEQREGSKETAAVVLRAFPGILW